MTSGRMILSAILLCGVSCSLALDLDKREGHPCTAQKACLPGYRCVEDVCVPAEGRGKLCDPACKDGKACDLRSGTCTDACSAGVCPTGEICATEGACGPPQSGLGAACTDDSECVSSIPGCQDGASPGTLLCGCFHPVGTTAGVCVAMPRLAEDCSACPEGSTCVEANFSRAGQTTICVPGGFRACAGSVDCMDETPDAAMHCGYLGWEADPLWSGSPNGLGLLQACVSDEMEAASKVGEICDPAAPLPCASGLCVDTPGEGHLCSAACGNDDGCVGIGVGRCVDAPLLTTVGARAIETTATLCGSAPTLGASCAVAAGGAEVCGTDAPLCRQHPVDLVRLCTRSCRTDADCPTEQGFACNPDGFYCF